MPINKMSEPATLNNNPNQTKKDKKESWKEPKVKWKKSKAKQLLYEDIMANRVPSEATDENRKSTMQLKDLYSMHPEYSQYYYSKFSAQVSSLWSMIKDGNSRAGEDK